jgi:acetyl-CoA acetyltransferase
MNNDIAIVAVSQTPAYDAFHDSEPVMIMQCVNDLLTRTGLERDDLEFTIAGSCDYLSGLPFAFVMNIDGVGAWPPVYESHVEMDGAWALFEAWLRLMLGDIDIALVIGSGKSSPGEARATFALQTDPYTAAPLGLDPVSMAGIQARALIDAGKATEKDFAEVVARSRRNALGNPNAQIRTAPRVGTCSTRPMTPHRCASTTSRRTPTARPPSSWPGVTALASSRRTPCGSATSTIASNRTTQGCATSRRRSPPSSPRRRSVSRRAPSMSPSSRSCTAPRS